MARILIVEPHADIQSLLEHVIRKLGHEPVLADSAGSETMDAAAAVIEPGDARGLPLARSLRESGCPVIFTSIFPADQESLDLEPVAYFVKPFGLTELRNALADALAHAHAHDPV